VIEHLTDIDGVLQEMHRVLRPGGKLIVTTPNRQEGRKWDPRHVKEFTASELATKLSTYFKVDKVYGSWPMHHFNAWRGKRLGRVWLEIQTRLGRNVFDEEVANPTSAYGQLTAVAYKP
jgi:SAM-dependent methyltransferase